MQYITDGISGVTLDFEDILDARMTEENLFVRDGNHSVTVNKSKNPELVDLILDNLKQRSNVEVISTVANDATGIDYRIEYNCWVFEVSFPDEQNFDRAVKALERQTRFYINTSGAHRFSLLANVNPYFRQYPYDDNKAALEDLLKG